MSPVKARSARGVNNNLKGRVHPRPFCFKQRMDALIVVVVVVIVLALLDALGKE
jgi:hypothetical protein